MSPTEDYLQGRIAQAAKGWAEERAAGRSWREVEAEILVCCESRTELLTQLLMHAETRDRITWTAPEPQPGPRMSTSPRTGRSRAAASPTRRQQYAEL